MKKIYIYIVALILLTISFSANALSVAINIEGKIIEVADDNKSFKLDNGKWVIINEDTELGISGPTAAPKEEQLFEPTFRVGNSIAGFTLDNTKDTVIAYAIYTNWNWDNPIRKEN